MWCFSSEGFGYVLFAASTIGVVQMFIGHGAMDFRKAHFKSKEFLEQPAVKTLQEEHKKEFGTVINETGYPDMGNGRYSALLSYSQWVQFNNIQRGHYGMIEGSAPVLATLILNGLFQPKVAAGLGFSYAVGRVLFAWGYQTKGGANNRMYGALFSGVGQLGLYIAAIYNGYQLVK
jgi:hypothetical protein